MLKYAMILVTLAAQHESVGRAGIGQMKDVGIREPVVELTVGVISTKVTDKILEIRYQIKNELAQDAWICESMSDSAASPFEVSLDQDGQTLLIRRQLGIPWDPGIAVIEPTGLYVRLPSGETRTEVMSLCLPAHFQFVFCARETPQAPRYVPRLLLRIGWYEGDLPLKILSMLRQAESELAADPVGDPMNGPPGILGHMGGSLRFVQESDCLRAPSDQVRVNWADEMIGHERVLELALDKMRIPYSEDEANKSPLPYIGSASSLEVQFQQSAMEFFFPYRGDQILLSEKEKQRLWSLDVIRIENQQAMTSLLAVLSDIDSRQSDAFFTNRGMADLKFRSDDGRVESLAAYTDRSLVTNTGQVHRLLHGMPALREATPEIRSLDLRVRCAANIRNLWRRLRVYGVAQHAPRDLSESWRNRQTYGFFIPPKALATKEYVYPSASHWCDALVQGFAVIVPKDAAETMYRCPSEPKGRCHYAMNLNCRYDSPGDMVLLFETKAGWNQHGGPELFTFDNHDPKGGCVLLNDGTAKFIRTEEELKQLRWK